MSLFTEKSCKSVLPSAVEYWSERDWKCCHQVSNDLISPWNRLNWFMCARETGVMFLHLLWILFCILVLKYVFIRHFTHSHTQHLNKNTKKINDSTLEALYLINISGKHFLYNLYSITKSEVIFTAFTFALSMVKYLKSMHRS